MPSRARDVDPGRLARWCVEHLGSPPADEIFRSGYLSAVIGVRLADDRAVVVKVRPSAAGKPGCNLGGDDGAMRFGQQLRALWMRATVMLSDQHLGSARGWAAPRTVAGSGVTLD